ncbi:MAG: phosphoglucosamine mutase [Deltaproteobacteria bacterium]|nr:phosphoglucosamine mutase [Deltaproteobacteria bacterium]MBN2670816.1 phosphoglucosamine mutase [Deltaproteobacteria bacterium]
MNAKRKLFGTDGIRGPANVHPMTGEVAMALGRALTHVARKKGGRKSPRIVIGKDTRVSGYMLETAIASGICSMGGEVMLVGPLPTPGISFITSSMRADAGVVISASHNPYNDNGIKLFWSDGFKLPDDVELELEKIILKNAGWNGHTPVGDAIGKAVRIDDALGRYIVELKHTFPKDQTLEGIKMVVDCANGAAYKAAPAVFEELGASLTSIGTTPNGSNINDNCGALHPEKAAIKVLELGAHVGITLDGDADRLILIDEKGQVVDGDAVMALCASHMIKEKTLNKKTVVTTVMSNLGLDKAIRKLGGHVVRTAVGDRYVVEEMRKNNFNLGGEQSGHLIFSDHSTTGDGILAALQILAIMVKEKKPLSELAEGIMKRIPQCLLSFRVAKRVPIAECPKTMKAIQKVEKILGDNGRVFVRYSGTEAKARVLVEGPVQDDIDNYAEEIKQTLVKELKN